MPRAIHRPSANPASSTPKIRSESSPGRAGAKSDGRTSATIEVPGSHPANLLAQHFVGIREALREADLGLAKLVLKGTAVAPGEPVAESP